MPDLLTPSEISRLNFLADRLDEAYKPLHIDQCSSPINRHEEREKLFAAHAAGVAYNPQFVYQEAPNGWDNLLKALLRDLDPTANTWEALIAHDAQQMLAKLEAVRTHDPELITATSISTNGLPSRELVAQAYDMLATLTDAPETESIPAEDAAIRFKTALDKAGLVEWDVALDELMQASMGVRSVEKLLKIRKGKLYSPQALQRLLVHEIGTHVFRAANGMRQPLAFLRLGLTDYLMTEEGLATYHERHFGVESPITLRRYALRAIAAHLSLTHTYYEVFAHLVQYTDLVDAFGIVIRAKRGFRDTSQYGAHVKDKVYLQGLLAVSAHLATTPDDYPLLMCGKVSLAMLPALRELQRAGLIHPPAFLPDILLS